MLALCRGGCIMSDILWSKFPKEDRETYIRYLKTFGALSGLFKDTTSGDNADKPYLYYRNHEQLYARCFDVEDLTRCDSAFDAVAKVESDVYGIGLKTWIHSRDISPQKVAEFGKASRTELVPLYDDPEALVKRVSELRNERIMMDKRLYNTTKEIYHYITRDRGFMNICECDYDLIDIDNISEVHIKTTAVAFKDGKNNYSFLKSKNTLLKEFDASKEEVIEQIKIDQVEDPFELIAELGVDIIAKETKQALDYIVLPLYSDKDYQVNAKSGFNMFNAAPKVKGSNRPRPAYEAYVTIPKWIYALKPDFFQFEKTIEELQKDEYKKELTLELPSGEKISARVTQDNGKSLQTNPQSILGEWILHDIFGLEPYEVLTREILNRYEVDSLIVYKIDEDNYKIELAGFLGFEKWKYNNRVALKQLEEDKKIQHVKIWEDILEEFNSVD